MTRPNAATFKGWRSVQSGRSAFLISFFILITAAWVLLFAYEDLSGLNVALLLDIPGNMGRVRAFGRVWDIEGRGGEICQIDWKGPTA